MSEMPLECMSVDSPKREGSANYRKTAPARKRWRARRQELGLCSNCPSPVAPGKTCCLACMEKTNRQCAIRLKKKKEQGICNRCNQNVKPSYSMCASCLLENPKYRRGRLRRGACAYCGKPGRPGKTMCLACLDKRRAQAKDREANGICKQLGCALTAAPDKKYCAKCIGKRSARIRALKQRVLDHYGQKCNCPCGCSVTNFAHLTVDHINNDGAIQRRRDTRSAGGFATYRLIIRKLFPKDLQILCWNCNCAKQFYGGCK